MDGQGSRRGQGSSAGGSFYSAGGYGSPTGGVAGGEFSYSFGGTDDQQFESFDYNSPAAQTASSQSYYDPSTVAPAPITQNYGPTSFYNPAAATMPVQDVGAPSFDNFADEPPLLEELGINPYYIMEKTRSVLNPLRHTNADILQDTDLAGPVVFCVLFGFILLLSGKVHFGYIYGIGVIGCLSMYFLLNMMSVAGVSLGVVVSVLGYCLLPMVGLAGVNLLLSLQGVVGSVLTIMSVLWCSMSASKLFVTALNMQKQQALVAYPCALVYGVFALLAVF